MALRNNPKLNGIPAAEKLGPAGKLVEERSGLHARRGKLGARRAELLNHRTVQAVKAADAELLGTAARKGSDLTKVGTPNADKHAADVKAVEHELRAVEGAIVQCEADLLAEVGANADALRADVDARIAAKQEAYRQAVAAARQARAALLGEATVADFLDRVAPPNVEDDGIASGPRVGQGSNVLRVGVGGVPAEAAFRAMAEEADTAFRRRRRVTTAAGPRGKYASGTYTPPSD
jgi:hypothetical protein